MNAADKKLTRDDLEQRLRHALRRALEEVKADPQFLQRIARVVCEELGADPLIGQYLVSKLIQGQRDG